MLQLNKKEKNLSKTQQKEIIRILKERFEKNMSRHKQIEWSKVQDKLEKNPQKLWSINEMERTGGEPDIIAFNKNDEYVFFDCASETPRGRRNTCYDREGENERKKQGIKTNGNAVDMSNEMGIELLSKEQYQELQKAGEFDTKTSSWLKTPPDIRKLGGGIFGDRRYNTVFIYHNGAQSFYAVRGFRGLLKI